VTLHGERDFVGGIKIKVLRLGDYPGLSSGPSVIRSVLVSKRKRESQSEIDLKMEEGAMSQGMQVTSRSWKKTRERTFP